MIVIHLESAFGQRQAWSMQCLRHAEDTVALHRSSRGYQGNRIDSGVRKGHKGCCTGSSVGRPKQNISFPI